jgi:hypothetical protein
LQVLKALNENHFFIQNKAGKTMSITNKPYGRKTKKKVGIYLMEDSRSAAMEKLRQIPDKHLVGPLFSYFYNGNDLIKFRSISAMGLLAAQVAEYNMERARIILRRIMWNLNDESGGIGWGSPEAMGEILALCPKLAEEFKSILLSYLDPDGNYIEHEILQRGVLWGIGTYLKEYPSEIDDKSKAFLYEHLHSTDPVRQAYSIRALNNALSLDYGLVPEELWQDECEINIYNGWDFVPVRISGMLKNKG